MDHIEELLKLEKASKGIFRGTTRESISAVIRAFDSKIIEIKSKSGEEKKEAIKGQLTVAQALRHDAVRRGANSYKDPRWASAAVVESWLLLLRDGTPEVIQTAESIIDRMR